MKKSLKFLLLFVAITVFRHMEKARRIREQIKN